MTDDNKVKLNSSIVLDYCNYAFNEMRLLKVIEFGGGKNRLKLPFKVDQLDRVKLESDDIVSDLENKLPLGNDSYDVIFSCSVFEHVFNIRQLFEECHRVLRPGGKLIIIVPHFAGLNSIYLTHKGFFSADYFNIFTAEDSDFNFETTARFKILKRKIRTVIRFLDFIANANQKIYEGTILKNILPPSSLIVVLEAVK